MANLLTKSNALIALLVAVIVWLLIQNGCNSHNATKVLSEAVNYPDTISNYKLKTGQLVATNKALLLQTDEQVRILTAKDKQLSELEKKFKSVYGAVQIKEVVRVVHDTIRFAEGKYRKDNDTIDFVAELNNGSLVIDTLSFTNIQSIVVGEKKTGLLSSQTTIDVVNSNKLISSNAIAGYVVHETKWYENSKTQFIAGCLVGGVLMRVIH